MALNGAERAEVMYSLHGESPGNTCASCCNLYRREYTNRYYKCEAYGDGCSTATDLAKSYPACGLWGKPFNRNTMPLGVKHARGFTAGPVSEQVEGQMEFGEDV